MGGGEAAHARRSRGAWLREVHLLPDVAGGGRLIALRSRDFRLLLAGQVVSLTGTQMQQVAVVWQLYLLTGSPLALGMLGFFRVAPIVVFALGGGVLADAFDRRKLMLVTQSALALVSLALAALSHAQRTSPAAIYGLAFVAGAATAFDNPARQALVPRLVDARQLPNALSLYVTVFQVATIAGPALGGLLLATTGPTFIYLVDVLSPWFWVSFVLLAVSGAADMVSALIRNIARQTLTPDELRGRISSVAMTFFMGGPQLGEVEAGTVARLFGARVSVVSGGVLCVLAAAAAAVLVPQLRRYES